MDAAEKERIRKREWYQKNKDALKKSRDEKKTRIRVGGEDPDIGKKMRSNMIYPWKNLFYLTVCAACTSTLIFLTASALGGGLLAWIISVLLEIGIITMAATDFKTTSETIAARTAAIVFAALSIWILHEGSFDGKESKVFADLAKAMIKNAEKMPESHVTRRSEVLEKASKVLTFDKSEKSKTSEWIAFAVRIFLIVENFFFARLFLTEKCYNNQA